MLEVRGGGVGGGEQVQQRRAVALQQVAEGRLVHAAQVLAQQRDHLVIEAVP